MSEALCGICRIDAARVLARAPGGIVAVPSRIARDGHVMVVSAAHAVTFAELQPGDADALMALVGEAARAAEAASGAAKCYVLRIGDKSRHLHFHVVPAAESDPPLAPFVFGDDGWSSGVSADALPPAPVFDPVFSASMTRAAARTPRLPPWLVGLALTLLAFAVASVVLWPVLGPPWAGPVALGIASAAGRVVDDRLKGVPVRWGHALLFGAVLTVAGYLMFQWLEASR